MNTLGLADMKEGSYHIHQNKHFLFQKKKLKERSQNEIEVIPQNKHLVNIFIEMQKRTEAQFGIKHVSINDLKLVSNVLDLMDLWSNRGSNIPLSSRFRASPWSASVFL